ncbi:hypothetical protein [Providencia vermicola]
MLEDDAIISDKLSDLVKQLNNEKHPYSKRIIFTY